MLSPILRFVIDQLGFKPSMKEILFKDNWKQIFEPERVFQQVIDVT